MKISTHVAVVLWLCLATGFAYGKSGIKGIFVFGDEFSDTGNSVLYDPIQDPSPGEEYPEYEDPYMPGRASNGPLWIEVVASAYGYDVSPALDGGRNYAFAGAETGTGFSDQGTLNLQSQVRLFKADLEDKTIKRVHPKDLFVIWAGINDFLRIEAEGGTINAEAIDEVAANIGRAILNLHDEGARLFLVPDLLALELTPSVLELGEDEQRFYRRLTLAFNQSLERVLQRVENDPKITIYRLSSYRIYLTVFDNPWLYGLDIVDEPALGTDPIDEDSPWAEYLSWDGLHPTAAGHALFAQYAMNVIPIGSWWGHSMARGPEGTAFLGMGWVDDDHWPWIYSYSYHDGNWMWVFEEGGDPEGFLAFSPRGYKWIWVNSLSGWFYDYEADRWKRIDGPEG